jgi:hypothetical protein
MTKLRHVSIATKVTLITLIITIAALLIPVRTTPTYATGVLGATAIFYSILIGFFTTSAMTNLSRLKTLVAIETGGLIAVYHIVRQALPERVTSFKTAVDNYLIKRFDYEVENYTEPTEAEFFNIFAVIHGANTDNQGDAAAMNYIGEAFYYLPQARREITVVGERVVSKMSWLVLIVLSSITVISLFAMRQPGLESSAVTVLLSTSAVSVLFILDDVDANRFGEEQFAVNTYHDVFRALGLVPYYSSSYLDKRGVKPQEAVYRVGQHGHVELINKEK